MKIITKEEEEEEKNEESWFILSDIGLKISFLYELHI